MCWMKTGTTNMISPLIKVTSLFGPITLSLERKRLVEENHNGMFWYSYECDTCDRLPVRQPWTFTVGTPIKFTGVQSINDHSCPTHKRLWIGQLWLSADTTHVIVGGHDICNFHTCSNLSDDRCIWRYGWAILPINWISDFFTSNSIYDFNRFSCLLKSKLQMTKTFLKALFLL